MQKLALVWTQAMDLVSELVLELTRSEFGAGSGFGISFRDDSRSRAVPGTGIGVGDIAVSVSRVCARADSNGS